MREGETIESRTDQIIMRCLRKDELAWEAMFVRFHHKLLCYIKFLMHGAGGDEQAEEIAAAVWSSLCGEDYSRLRRYNPESGGFLRYLALLARGEVWRWRRADGNRLSRECRAARRESVACECERGIQMREFLATLTRREREFCLGHLLNETDPISRREISDANEWQLRSRVKKKLIMYLEVGEKRRNCKEGAV